jgi:hypothetical protein
VIHGPPSPFLVSDSTSDSPAIVVDRLITRRSSLKLCHVELFDVRCFETSDSCSKRCHSSSPSNRRSSSGAGSALSAPTDGLSPPIIGPQLFSTTRRSRTPGPV